MGLLGRGKLCFRNGRLILIFLFDLGGVCSGVCWLCLNTTLVGVKALGVHIWNYDQIIIISRRKAETGTIKWRSKVSLLIMPL
jgi:hypothetical protein